MMSCMLILRVAMVYIITDLIHTKHSEITLVGKVQKEGKFTVFYSQLAVHNDKEHTEAILAHYQVV